MILTITPADNRVGFCSNGIARAMHAEKMERQRQYRKVRVAKRRAPRNKRRFS